MWQVIHARERNGKTVFRLFSENSDTYVTGEITEEELRAQLLFDALWSALEGFNLKIGLRIERARETGTSSMVGPTSIKPSDQWEKEREENKFLRAPDWPGWYAKAVKEKNPHFKALLKQVFETWED